VTRFKPSSVGVTVTFEPDEVTVLRDLSRQITQVLDGGVPDHGSDAVRDRLFPRAYVDPTEDRAERDFQSVVHQDLVRAKSEAVSALINGLDDGRDRRGRIEVVLRPPAIEQWVGALNDVRLALGVTLGVTEDRDEVDADDPQAPAFGLYDWLTYVQGTLVDVLMGGLG
jgi:Domain of unknown function (DUF2017).